MVRLNVVWMLHYRERRKTKDNAFNFIYGDDKETVNHAVAGDIIGLYDTGNYQIGDTIVGGNQKFTSKTYHNLHLNYL